MERSVALVYDAVFKKHDAGRFHPESPGRCDAVISSIQSSLSDDEYERIRPRMATMDEVVLAHDPDYFDLVKREIETGFPVLSTGDTNICSDSYEAAMYAVGGLCDAVDFVMKDNSGRAFCVVRPPGHHACRAKGMGFCVFNNIAVAARYARKVHGVKRVLIADWDVHHGNGTQDIFYDDPDVFFFSTHQWPMFPGTGRRHERGEGDGKGTTLNFPFPPGSGSNEVLGAFRHDLRRSMKQFKPELVLVSAGFDSRRGDTIGNFELTDADFEELTGIVCEIADEYCGGRLVSTLEGGYDFDGLGSASATHFARLLQ